MSLTKKAKEKRTNKKKISANNTRNTINLGRLTCDWRLDWWPQMFWPFRRGCIELRVVGPKALITITSWCHNVTPSRSIREIELQISFPSFGGTKN